MPYATGAMIQKLLPRKHHEDKIPQLDDTIVIVDEMNDVPSARNAVVVDLGARSARTGGAGLPKVLLTAGDDMRVRHTEISKIANREYCIFNKV